MHTRACVTAELRTMCLTVRSKAWLPFVLECSGTQGTVAIQKRFKDLRAAHKLYLLLYEKTLQ